MAAKKQAPAPKQARKKKATTWEQDLIKALSKPKRRRRARGAYIDLSDPAKMIISDAYRKHNGMMKRRFPD